jgi:hypothetical protein
LKRTSPLPNIIKPSSNFTSIENSNSEKNHVQMNMFLPICILSTMENELFGSDLNNLGKDTKKVLSKIDLSSPIDK